MHDLERMFSKRIASGLDRCSVKLPSQWSVRYRMMGGETPGKWTFDAHPWSRGILDSQSRKNCIMKSAQSGCSEDMINLVFFYMDVKKVNCLYVLPNRTPDASDFSMTRFDVAIQLSEHLSELFTDTKNVGLKRAGPASLWIRGSRSKKGSGLTNIDPTLVVLDELDRMPDTAIQMAKRRSDGQEFGILWFVSTPTIPERGIHSQFLVSTQEHWMFKCPHCDRLIEMVYPDSLVVCGDSPTDPDVEKSHYICVECKHEIEHEEKKDTQLRSGVWVPKNTESNMRGFYVNQLSSFKRRASDIAADHLEALTNPAAEQELWNQIAGLPHVVSGGAITDEDLNACTWNYTTRFLLERRKRYQIVTMGVDVGKWLHYEIDGWKPKSIGPDVNLNSMCHVLRAGKVKHFYELTQLMRLYNVTLAVVDWGGEIRATWEWACSCYGRVIRCQYARGQSVKRMTRDPDDEELKVNVHKQFWLDMALGRVRTRKLIRLPKDVGDEYRWHLKNQVKHYRREEKGDGETQDVYEWLKRGEDHLAHARTYAEIALPLVASKMANKPIESFL